MTVEESTPMSPEELVVSVEQADALIDLIGIEEGSSRMSSVVLASGLVGAGLAGINGLTGDAEAILGPARTVDSRITVRVVSPWEGGEIREVRIWPSQPRSVAMRTEADGVHFMQVDYCEVPHILAIENLLTAGASVVDGPPFIPAEFVQAVRALDLEEAQAVLVDLAAHGASDSHFSQDCWYKRWSFVQCVREDNTPDGWKEMEHVECFVTDHLHALIHAPLDPDALADMQGQDAPTLDVPPRTALWALIMALFAG